MPLPDQVLGFALYAQPAPQHPFGVKPGIDRRLHLLPHVHQVIPDFRPFAFLHELPEAQVPLLAVGPDLGKGAQGIDILGGGGGLALDFNLSTAHAVHPPASQAFPTPESLQVHGVGVPQLSGLRMENHTGVIGGKGVFDCDVSQMAPACFGQGAIERNLKAVRLGEGLPEPGGGRGGSHGVGAGGPSPNAVQFSQ